MTDNREYHSFYRHEDGNMVTAHCSPGGVNVVVTNRDGVVGVSAADFPTRIGDMTADELADLIDQRIKAVLQAERDPRRRL